MMTVPGSMPKIILDCFCTERIIFEAQPGSYEQKYQNNSRKSKKGFSAFCVWTACIPAVELSRLLAGDPAAQLATVAGPGTAGPDRSAAMATVGGGVADAPELGDRGPQMAAGATPDRWSCLLGCIQSGLYRDDDGLLYTQQDGRIPGSHPLYQGRPAPHCYFSDPGVQHCTADDHPGRRFDGSPLSQGLPAADHHRPAAH